MSYTRALRTIAHSRSSLILVPSLAIPSVRTQVPQYARGYATTESKKPAGSLLLWFGVGILGAGAGYYLYASNKPTRSLILSTPKPFVTKNPLDYTVVYKAIASRLEEDNAYDNGSYGPILVRLAWHASGTYSKEDNTGGSNGATMRYDPEGSHGANIGLNVARDHLEKIKQQFPEISYSDLWTLAGVVAVQEMGGPIIPWRSGRVDSLIAKCPPDGRLPNPALGSDHIRNVFYRMGMNDQEIVALLGAHSLGRCHRERSGYEGPWTPSPTVFTNDFYNQLLTKKWVEKKWDGPKQYEDKETKELMMLPADIVLVTDKNFKKYVELYANDNQKFFEDFAKVYQKLLELGVSFPDDSKEYRFTPINQ